MNKNEKYLEASAVAVACSTSNEENISLKGAILTGTTNIGKSSTIIDIIEKCNFGQSRLISDDIVNFQIIEKENTQSSVNLFPPENIKGMIEIRHVGIFNTGYCHCQLDFHFHILDRQDQKELPRISEPQYSEFFIDQNIFIPKFTLYRSPTLSSQISFIVKNFQPNKK